jgi:hypothetical protein
MFSLLQQQQFALYVWIPYSLSSLTVRYCSVLDTLRSTQYSLQCILFVACLVDGEEIYRHYPLHSRCHRRPLNSPPTQATTNVKTISGATSESLYVKNAITTAPYNSVYSFFYCMLHHIHNTLWPIVNCYRRMCGPYQDVDIVAWKWSGTVFKSAQNFLKIPKMCLVLVTKCKTIHCKLFGL